MAGLLVSLLLLAGAPLPAPSPQPNVTAILPADDPPGPVAAAYAPPAARPPAQAPAARADELPPSVVAPARVAAFVSAEVVCGLVLWALVTLPVVCLVTGPLALGLAFVVVPVVSATAAVVAGDYLSGDRHSLAWSILTAILGSWVATGALVLLDAALVGGVSFLGYQLLRGVLGGKPEVVLTNVRNIPGSADAVGAAWRAGTFAPLVAAAVLGAVLSVVGFLAFLVLPGVANSVVLELTRQEVEADQKLPRMW